MGGEAPFAGRSPLDERSEDYARWAPQWPEGRSPGGKARKHKGADVGRGLLHLIRGEA